MKRESFQGVLLGIVIMCAVFAFITVAWAGLSSTLSISGTAAVAAQSWKVGFGNTSGAVLTEGTTTVTTTGSTATGLPNTLPTLTANTFGLTTGETPSRQTIAEFSAPGEKVVYTWYTVNEGTFAAKVTAQQNFLSALTTAGSNITLSCSVSSGNFDAQDFCDKYIKATLAIDTHVYLSGDIATAAAATATASQIRLEKPTGTPTPTPTSATNVLTIEYLDTIPASALPPVAVTVNLAQPIQITYGQA